MGPNTERPAPSDEQPQAVRLTSDNALFAVARFEEGVLKPEVVLA